MSILTKIFVVLATILSLLLVPAIVTHVKMAQEYKTGMEDAQANAETAHYRANAIESLWKKKLEGLDKAKAELVQQNAELSNALVEKQTLIQNRDVSIITLQNEKEGINSRLGELASALDQANKIIDQQKAELAQVRQSELTLSKKNVELNEKLSEKMTEVEMMTQQLRLQKERLQETTAMIAELTAEVDRLQKLVPEGAGTDEQVAVVATPVVGPIKGVITAIQQVGTEGATFAQVNIGSNDMVAEGMTFIIHSGNQFLGNLTITKVDLNESAGRVSLAQGPITANLEVYYNGK